MVYTFKLELKKEISRLTLLEDDVEKAVKEWPEARDMGRRLFEAIEELLKGQGLKPEDVAYFTVESDMPDGYTSMRIAETVKRVYTYSVTLLRPAGASAGKHQK